jgi:hypothetical protein
MTLWCARTARRPEGIWHPAATLLDAGLPTLFAKLAARGLAWREKGAADGDVRENALLV